MTEIKDIPNYEDFYYADDSGKIFSKERIDYLGRYWPSIELKQIKTAGYLYVSLFKDGVDKRFASHRIIGLLFVPNPENKKCINHLNGIKDDNRKVNLEWATHSENNLHAYETGLRKSKTGKDHSCSKQIVQFDCSGNELNKFGSIKEAARAIGKPKGNGSISNAVNGVTKSAYGFNWEYLGEQIN